MVVRLGVLRPVGAVGAAGLHVVAYGAFAAGAGLLEGTTQRQVYWLSLAAAYGTMIGLAWTGFGGSTPGRRFDAWLIALIPAASVTAWMVQEKWPLHVGITTAHGFGPSGGEANAAFLPFLHLAAWWGTNQFRRLRSRRAIQQAHAPDKAATTVIVPSRLRPAALQVMRRRLAARTTLPRAVRDRWHGTSVRGQPMEARPVTVTRRAR